MSSNNDNKLTNDKLTITLTFGDQAENHVGMQKIGKSAAEGFTLNDIGKTKLLFEKEGALCELINLNLLKAQEKDCTEYNDEEARVLIIRGGLDILLRNQNAADDMLKEQLELEWDTKARIYGEVKDKHARYNLCYSDHNQAPDYENGKGTIVSYDDLPFLNKCRERLPKFFGKKAKLLQCEGNKYYDVNKCYIGFHGDAERKIVIAFRLGATLPLHYQWYCESKPIGLRLMVNINHGDIYMMSSKAVGTDWRKRKIPTLRHAAGHKQVLEKKTNIKMVDSISIDKLLI